MLIRSECQRLKKPQGPPGHTTDLVIALFVDIGSVFGTDQDLVASHHFRRQHPALPTITSHLARLPTSALTASLCLHFHSKHGHLFKGCLGYLTADLIRLRWLLIPLQSNNDHNNYQQRLHQLALIFR